VEPQGLFVTLVYAVGAALIGGALAARLGQSVILGYVVAGMVIGPFTPGFVGDLHVVQALADIGITFLMFAIGVQITLPELVRAGRIATAGGLVQVAGMIGVGYLVGTALGWRPLEAVFFGAVIAISSSTVLTKILAERAEMDSTPGRIALAWSAIQDLATVVLVLTLPAIAAGGDRLALDLVLALGKAALFLACAIPIGSRVLPWFFDRIAALRNREVFILATAAVALGTAYLSSFFGLSLALGAFVAGIVVGESDLAHQILGEVIPLRDIFAGLFFVSVGMLVDPALALANLPVLLLVLALIVLIKGVLCSALVWLARYPARTAILTGVLLGQSAEFSFLLARLGVDLGVVSASVFSLLMAGTAISTVLAPPLYQASDPVLRWLDRRLPASSLAAHPYLAPESTARPRAHTVLCGFGRVGRIIGEVLLRRGFRMVVIEQDQRLVRDLRAQGIVALLGNAANPVLLERANLKEARLLVVAITDPLAARQLVDYARAVNPQLDIVARTHSADETAFMRGRGVTEAVMGETELALEMTRHALHRFGVSALETQAIVGRLREQLTVEAEE
jgi:CPA2 family monovalent cation:H+ antiporter-2